jgi:hypothetical protein
VNPKETSGAKVSTKPYFGDAVSVIATSLFPCAVIRSPVACTAPLPIVVVVTLVVLVIARTSIVPSITIVTTLPPVLLIGWLSRPVPLEVLRMLAILIACVRLLRMSGARLILWLPRGRLSLLSSFMLFPIVILMWLLGILNGRLGLRLNWRL